METLTTFAERAEFERAVALLGRLRVDCKVVSPDPGYSQVGVPALVLSPAGRSAFLDAGGSDLVSLGWVDYRAPAETVPEDLPRSFAEDILGRMAIVLLAPCVADLTRLRLVARFSGDVAEALPYVNAVLLAGSYMPKLPAFTYMDGHRMISLFRDHVAVAKADDIVDAWATLERVRRLVGDVWTRRAEITPSLESRRRPPALEIYRRLPGTNCGLCGLPSCTAFAWAVWRGEAGPRDCLPVFEGGSGNLEEALLAICAGLGVPDEHGE